MKIINIVDIHGNVSPINKIGDLVSSADLVLVAGDVTNFGRRQEAEDVIGGITKYNENVFAVTGNCDYQEVDDYLTENDMNLHGLHKTMGNVSFFGAGGSLECPSPTPNIYTEQEFRNILEAGIAESPPDNINLMVCHQPPIDTTNDTLTDGTHVGSEAIREFIEQHSPDICFTGHIHEAPGIDEIGATKIVNPGPLGTRHYTYIEIGDSIDVLEIRKF